MINRSGEPIHIPARTLLTGSVTFKHASELTVTLKNRSPTVAACAQRAHGAGRRAMDADPQVAR